MSKYPGFIFAADTHLSELTWKGRPTLSGDPFYSMYQIVRLCIEKGLPLLLGGDLFDKDRPDSRSILEMQRCMQLMSDAKLPVFFIEGQHERAQPPWMLACPDVISVDGAQFEISGHKFYGLSWAPHEVIQERVKLIPPDVEFVMMHQVWCEHMGNVVVTPEVSVHDMPHGLCVLSGDYHVTQITQHNTACGQVTLVSPGSISLRSIKEPPQKYVFEYQFETKKFVKHELNTRFVIAASISSAEGLDGVASAVNEALQRRPAVPDDLHYQNAIREPIACISYDDRQWDTAYRDITERLQNTHLFLTRLEFTEVGPEVQNTATPVDAPLGSQVCELIRPCFDTYRVPFADMQLFTDRVFSGHISPPRVPVAELVDAVRKHLQKQTIKDDTNAAC